MGNEPSSPDSEQQQHQAAAAAELAKLSESGRGRESLISEKEVELESDEIAPSAPTVLDEEVEAVLVEEPALVESETESDESESEDDESEDESEDEYDEEDEELEEGLRERLRILEDARALKNLAAHFLRPELPVSASPEVFGRNYFRRASAPEREDADDAEAIAEALADAKRLKKSAFQYAHPEEMVRTEDAAATARCFFGRPSAPARLSKDEADEVARSLSDADRLKKLAVDHAHPEAGVKTSDPAALGRNFFARPSAEAYEEEKTDADRDDVLADMAELKKAAFQYLHPEAPVEVDPTAFGRNYFNRASAPETEEEDIDAERDEVFQDVAELRKLASDFAHPENPVDVDPVAFGRGYFGRASAPDQDEAEDAEERAASLADALALKELAADYAHPEKPVVTSDPAAFGRNYFGRPSAGEYEEEEIDADRDDILADIASLKRLAVDFAHPEKPVQNSDPTTFGRNYFNRASAPDTEEEDMDAERDEVLEDILDLKKLASDFSHPERPVAVDPAAFGRNYFGCASAPDQEDQDEAEERATALADALALKKLAADFAHPEVGVATSDPAAFGRNYFARPSAGEYEEEEVDADRDDVLADVAALQKLTADYAHPERPVETSDPTAFGRNYFNRASAPDTEEEEIDAERDEVLEDVLALKNLAADFAHPERPVDINPAAYGRNYFGHASAPDQEDQDEAEERAAALADAKALKKLAADYSHPEVGVATSDPAAFGRNYFSRPSAEEYEEEEVDADRDDALADMMALKKLAVDYAHPKKPVETADLTVFGRNYFNRASAPQTEDRDESEERAAALAEAAALKKLSVDFAHPERPVDVDPASFGRNYFGRPSAPDREGESDVEERAAVLAEVSRLRKLARDYAHPEESVGTADPAAFGRSYFTRPSAPEQDGQDEAEERVRSLADASGLEKLAKDFAHPEVGVDTTDPTAMARCYFSRYSSPTHRDDLITAKNTAKPAAQAAPLGGEFEHVPAASDEQPRQGEKKAPQEGDIPRTSSSHMLFGMAEAS